MTKKLYLIITEKLPEQLEKSIALIRNYQTYRAAKEFAKTVKMTYEEYKLPLQTSLFFEKEDYLQIFYPNKITELMIRRKREASLIGMIEIDPKTGLETAPSILVECRRAYSIPEAIDQINRGEADFYDDLPIAMRLDNQIKIFRRKNYERQLNRLKFS